jgi:hypothetical protein
MTCMIENYEQDNLSLYLYFCNSMGPYVRIGYSLRKQCNCANYQIKSTIYEDVD